MKQPTRGFGVKTFFTRPQTHIVCNWIYLYCILLYFCIYTHYIFSLSVLNLLLYTIVAYDLCCDVFFFKKKKQNKNYLQSIRHHKNIFSLLFKTWQEYGSCQLKGYILILNAIRIGNPRELEHYLAMLLSFLKEFPTNIYRRYCQKSNFKVKKSFSFAYIKEPRIHTFPNLMQILMLNVLTNVLRKRS